MKTEYKTPATVTALHIAAFLAAIGAAVAVGMTFAHGGPGPCDFLAFLPAVLLFLLGYLFDLLSRILNELQFVRRFFMPVEEPEPTPVKQTSAPAKVPAAAVAAPDAKAALPETKTVLPEAKTAAPSTAPIAAPGAVREDFQYFLRRNNESTGPFLLSELLTQMRAGKLRRDAQVQRTGSTNWVPLETLAG